MPVHWRSSGEGASSGHRQHGFGVAAAVLLVAAVLPEVSAATGGLRRSGRQSPVVMVPPTPGASTASATAGGAAATAVAVAPQPQGATPLGATQQITPNIIDAPPPPIETLGTGEFLMLQRVGLDSTGIEMPRSPRDPGANICLTAGVQDRLHGQALQWATCENTMVKTAITDKQREEAQTFEVLAKGRLRSKVSGLCVRRVMCDELDTRQYVYDLGSCFDDMVVEFLVNKVIANNIYKVQKMGTLEEAIRSETCTMCGPYQLSDTGSFYGSNGFTAYQGRPGWSKQPVTYIGEDAVHGRMPLDESVSDDLMEGLGNTDDDGICGSYVTDAPPAVSLFTVYRDENAGLNMGLAMRGAR